MHWCLCQRLLVLVAVTGGGVIAVLAGVLAVALVAVSLVLLLGVWRADSLCRYIQPYGSADIYSHTAGILSSRHLLILRAHTATAHLSFQTITRSLIPVYTTRNLL